MSAGGVTVIPCDASPGLVERIRSRSDFDHVQLPGGGGTDMGSGIQAAQQVRPSPHILVVFTDGYTPWPEQQPREFASVIVFLSEGTAQDNVPAWARYIEFEQSTSSL